MGKTTVFVMAFGALLSFADANPPPALKPVPKMTKKADPLLSKYWHLNTIRAAEAWKVSMGSYETKIAVVDSGIDYNHPELAANLYRKQAESPADNQDSDGNEFIDDIIGWDFVRGHYLPFDRSGHGTFMASIIAGVFGNGIGGAGVCPRCSLISARFINWEGLGDTEDAVLGIEYAAEERASVINVSFAGEGYDYDLRQAIRLAGKSDSVVVVSAGNDGLNIEKESIYPAKFEEPNMITVAASTPNDELMEGSNWGSVHVALAAPGEDVPGIWLGHFDTGSGTSQAAAVVSGAAGLVRSIDPSLTAETVVRILKETARPVPSLKHKVTTGGILDLASAVTCARQSSHPCLR